MNNRLNLSYVLRAESSIIHNGGEVFTTTSLFRREKFVLPDGKAIDLPVVSGNSMRGILRDISAEILLRKTGINGIDIAAFDLLFSGGSLSEGPEKIDIDKIRHLRKTIPPISVFGGSVQNIILPGKAKVGKLMLLCKETAHLFDDSLSKYCTNSVYDLMQTEMYVRKDDAKNELLASFLNEAILEETKKGSSVKDLRASSSAQQMMYRFETIASGAMFYFSMTVEEDKLDKNADAIDKGCFLSAWDWFIKYKQSIGGRSSAGHGQVSIYDIIEESVTSQEKEDLIANYYEFLEKNKESVLLALSSLK